VGIAFVGEAPVQQDVTFDIGLAGDGGAGGIGGAENVGEEGEAGKRCSYLGFDDSACGTPPSA